MKNLPTGTVTFLFTDIEGSTKLAQAHPDKWDALQQRHHAILQSAIESHNGYGFQVIGDAFCAAFHTANEGINAAIEAQSKLQSEDWGETPVKVRMGIHTGEAELQSTGDYHGYLAMSRVQRLMSAGHGGQTLISQATQELIRDNLPKAINLRDLGEKRLKDLIRPERIYQLIVPDLPIDFPPLKTLDAYRHNLPVQLTSFIGREKEMVEIKTALNEHRLVTLTGSGGAGKTRLSLQVAADLLDSFPNGIWFVELAPITDPDLIPQTILSAADMQTQQGRSALDSLKDFLREKTSLLVLDNCEHLIEACAKLADTLLHTAPNLKILASSREALGVRGEQAWHVPSLSIPDLKHLPPIEQLSQYEAVRLFIDRALLVQPHFAVTNDNAPAVAQICSRLDGIPLAIELAAARVKVLKAEQIAERLNDRFRLLTGGSRTALPRQQTLRAMIDWSYDLLSKNERTLLRRLAVFSGGCTLEATEHVCSDENIQVDDILDLLMHLVDKSLVVIDEGPSQLRYRILETVRQYAREKLMESGEGEQIRKRHLDYFLKLTEEAEPQLKGAGYIKAMNQLAVENPNILAAMDWALEVGYEEGQRLIGALWWFWSDTGNSEGLDWAKRGLAVNNGTPTPLRIRLLTVAGWLAYMLKLWDESIAYCNEAIAITRQIDPPKDAAWPLATLGLISLLGYSDLAKAEALLQESLVLFRNDQDKNGVRSVLSFLGWVFEVRNDYEQAERLYQESLKVSKESGNVDGMSWALISLAGIAEVQGNYAHALSLSDEALSLLQGANTVMELWYLQNKAVIYLQMGDHGEVKKYLEQVIPLYRERGEISDVIVSTLVLGTTARYEGEFDKARSLFIESLKLAQQSKDDIDIALTLINIAALLRVKGFSDKFARLLGSAENIVPEGLWQTIYRIFRVDIEQAIELARVTLGEYAYNAAYAEGRTMKIEDAIAYALKELEQ